MCVNILDLLFLRHSSATWDERIFRYYTNISKEDPHSITPSIIYSNATSTLYGGDYLTMS